MTTTRNAEFSQKHGWMIWVNRHGKVKSFKINPCLKRKSWICEHGWPNGWTCYNQCTNHHTSRLNSQKHQLLWKGESIVEDQLWCFWKSRWEHQWYQHVMINHVYLSSSFGLHPLENSSILPLAVPEYSGSPFSMHSRWNRGRRLDIHGCGGRLLKNMNTCTHIVVDHQRALIFRHQQCNFSHFGCKNASTDIHSRLKVCEVSCFQSFRIPEFFTRWKEGEDSSQDRRWWDDMGNVDTAACSNPVVDACIFPLDHQALQDFSNHQHMHHMSSVKTPEKKKDLTAYSC